MIYSYESTILVNTSHIRIQMLKSNPISIDPKSLHISHVIVLKSSISCSMHCPFNRLRLSFHCSLGDQPFPDITARAENAHFKLSKSCKGWLLMNNFWFVCYLMKYECLIIVIVYLWLFLLFLVCFFMNLAHYFFVQDFSIGSVSVLTFNMDEASIYYFLRFSFLTIFVCLC